MEKDELNKKGRAKYSRFLNHRRYCRFSRKLYLKMYINRCHVLMAIANIVDYEVYRYDAEGQGGWCNLRKGHVEKRGECG